MEISKPKAPKTHYPSWYARKNEQSRQAEQNSNEIQNQLATDSISRRAAITAIDNCECDGEDSCGQPWIYKENAVEAIEMVEPLPPAQPERIKGHWIESNGLNILMKKFIEKGETWRMCDKCGAGFMIGYQYECDKLYHETFHNFCPNCGADMRGVTE